MSYKSNLKSYSKLASTKGHGDPLEYLFNRLKVMKAKGRHDAAVDLAKYLVPYGHARRAPVDEAGDTPMIVHFVLD